MDSKGWKLYHESSYISFKPSIEASWTIILFILLRKKLVHILNSSVIKPGELTQVLVQVLGIGEKTGMS